MTSAKRARRPRAGSGTRSTPSLARAGLRVRAAKAPWGLSGHRNSCAAEHALHQKGGLDDIAAVVPGTERNGLAGLSMDPMRPHPVIAWADILQEARHPQNLLERLPACEEPALDPDKDGHDPEAGPAGGNDVPWMAHAFPGQAADRGANVVK